ncbi:glycosyltransferase family 4 protein [Chitinophaga defluvii]|uniref:Glycosyltransferase family 1 protein n=1 Tax=Chitinophaga defluvii TaxID=3163343 RepID=A0ABV2T5B2_9BACT
MNIAFDAKRAFQNNTGLGNYSRTLIQSLVKGYPAHSWYLFAPKQTSMFLPAAPARVVVPEKIVHRWFKSAWRSKYVVKELQEYKIDLYHGLSHEIPFGIHESGVKSVVTMHDLIFERYPGQYNPIDVFTYRRKARYACRHADRIIAISEQTKQDIITYYQIPAEKIAVAYQSCDPAFSIHHSPVELAQLRAKYNLPHRYFLYVGSVIERKNLLGVVKAMQLLQGTLSIPLVILGNGSSYKKKVKEFIAANGLEQQVIWLNEQARLDFTEVPVLYQGATALLYPSVFEGFGIPILEALCSLTPVITSQGSCFGETGGDAALYIDPLQPETLAAAMQRVATDTALVNTMKEKGWAHAQHFTPEKCAAGVMQVYEAVGRT